jgi:pyrroloquinoline quinone biosynthesis protein D
MRRTNQQAIEILRLVDGARDVDAIIDELARRYEAPRQVTTGDIVAMLQNLVDKKVLRR